MFDKISAKLMEGAISSFVPKIEEITKTRANELISLKEKIRTNPEEVESWFDKEILKVKSMNLGDMVKEFNNLK